MRMGAIGWMCLCTNAFGHQSVYIVQCVHSMSAKTNEQTVQFTLYTESKYEARTP